MKGSAQTSARSASRQERRLGNETPTCLVREPSTGNCVHQYTSRDVPGGFDVVSIANSSAFVTLNSAFVDYRREDYFRKQVTAANANVH